MKPLNAIPQSPRLYKAIALTSLLMLAATSNLAVARGCGMKYMPGQWGMPEPGARQQGVHKGMTYRPMRHSDGRVRGSVVELARAGGEFSTLLAALDKAGLLGILEGQGPFTLLAPRDSAFEKLPAGALEELLGDRAKLAALLKYHLLPGRVTAVDILQSRELKTASGQKLPTVDLAIVRADVHARNGVIHVVDEVLLPKG